MTFFKRLWAEVTRALSWATRAPEDDTCVRCGRKLLPLPGMWCPHCDSMTTEELIAEDEDANRGDYPLEYEGADEVWNDWLGYVDED